MSRCEDAAASGEGAGGGDARELLEARTFREGNAGGPGMRFVFTCYLVVIAAGLAYGIAIGFVNPS